jgi:nucleotide-binding universal stress UspA family protein
MFSNIVVGTDGSDTAALAVELAVDLARQHGAKLHLVTAFRAPGAVAGGGISVGDPSDGHGLYKLAAEKTLAEVSDSIEGLDVETHAGSGSPASVIVDFSDEVGADLIVVGSKGMQGTRRILGSVPNTVAHNAACHVLVAKTV